MVETEAKHTHGPWGVVRMGDGSTQVRMNDGDGDVIAEIAPWSDCVDNADARLISAAPDLLEACKQALEHVRELREAWRTGSLSEHDGRGGQRSNRNVDVDVALSKAITKATGEEFQ